jgi:glycosyltransferase involved in cell wall biosynthesis
VLVVTQPVDGGVGACVQQLLEAAVTAGHRTVLASPAERNAPFAVAATDMGASHVTLLDDRRKPHLRDVRAVLALRRLMRHRDIVHLHSSKAGAVGRLAAVSLGRKRPRVAFTPHAWSWLVGGRSAFLYRAIERLLARASDVIVAVSQSEASEGTRVLGGAARRVIVIENGVDRERFSPEGQRAPRDEAVPLITCVGRLTRQKGQDLALRAVAAMRNKNAHIRFVGDGDAATSLVDLSQELGIEDRVEWQGAVADTAPQFRAADVVVAPSRWEGMSLVFLEAMACGAALVASDVQGAEIVGDAGVLVTPEDHEAIARALDALLDDEARREELGTRARMRSQAYDVNQTTARNLAMWQLLTSSSGSGHDWQSRAELE